MRHYIGAMLPARHAASWRNNIGVTMTRPMMVTIRPCPARKNRAHHKRRVESLQLPTCGSHQVSSDALQRSPQA